MPQVDAALTPWTPAPPTTLLVDRDADTRQLYAAYLRQAQCRIEEAEDGREALAKAISRHPDIVVTETRLPGISGLDLCALLRNDSVTAAIPIVFVTGDAHAPDVERAAAAGADAVLIKPCLPETLAVEMRRVLSRSHELREHARRIKDKVVVQLDRARELIDRSQQQQRRHMLSREYDRHQTVHPPVAAPPLVCPLCDQPLTYQHSHIGGVSARNPEQWDYYECPGGCGLFQYRQRTRRVRQWSSPPAVGRIVP